LRGWCSIVINKLALNVLSTNPFASQLDWVALKFLERWAGLRRGLPQRFAALVAKLLEQRELRNAPLLRRKRTRSDAALGAVRISALPTDSNAIGG
tara:strand:+ start:279 stop:566 length:288 start_codon:yes stop_codon:yes gene_type:complete